MVHAADQVELGSVSGKSGCFNIEEKQLFFWPDPVQGIGLRKSMGCLMVIMVFLSDIVTEDSLAENREICKHLSKVYFKNRKYVRYTTCIACGGML